MVWTTFTLKVCFCWGRVSQNCLNTRPQDSPTVMPLSSSERKSCPAAWAHRRRAGERSGLASPWMTTASFSPSSRRRRSESS